MSHKGKKPTVTTGDKGAAEILYNFAVELAEKKYAEEKEREESLIAQSNQLQTVFSIVTGVLFLALPICIDHRRNIPITFFVIVAAIIFFTLTVSLVLSSIAQWRFKTKVMPDVSTIEDIILKGNDWESLLKTESQQKMYFEQLKIAQESKCKNNDCRVKLTIASIICFWCSIAEGAIGAIIALCIL